MKHGKMILGELHADIPVIQGGMGVGISLSGLAGAVAAAGGIGIISTAQIGFREPDFDRDPIACNLRTIGKEIEKARQTARGGIVGVNIMVATQRYEDYVRAAVLAGTDCIISGAGRWICPESWQRRKTECPGAATGRCWLRSCRAPVPCRSSRNTG
jgi:nitronate monooxygenase